MKTLQINRLRIPFPESWNELTANQLLMICKFYSKTLDYTLMRQLIFCNLAGLTILKRKEVAGEDEEKTGYWFEYKKQKFRISAIDLAWLLKFTDFIFDSYESKNTITYYIRSQISEQKIPSVVVDGIKYYGPHSHMSNTPWIEWQTCMIHYKNYKTSGDISNLNKLCASLYREKRKDIALDDPKMFEDKRSVFTDFAVDDRALKIAPLSFDIKIAILFYFEGCIVLLERLYPEVFRSPKPEGKATTKKPQENINIGLMLEDVVVSLSKNDPKLFDVYRQLNLHDMLRGLCKNIQTQS